MSDRELLSVVDAVYSATGFGTLHELVGNLAKTVGADFVLVSELINGSGARARTHSFLAHGNMADNFEYDLPDALRIDGQIRHACIIDQNVENFLADAVGLNDPVVKAYIGLPLFGSDIDPIGVMAVLNQTPFDDPQRICSLLKIYASRIANELDCVLRQSVLQSSEAKFRNLVEKSIQGICIHREMHMLFVNPAFAEMLGYDSPEFLMSDPSVLKLIHPDDRERILGYKDLRMAGRDAPSRYEVRFLRRDGTVVWVDTIAHVIEWEGEPAIQSTTLDITERKLAEERLHSVLENVTDGIFRTTREGELLWANTGVARIAGFESVDDMVAAVKNVTSEIYVNPDDRLSLLGELEANGSVRDFVAQMKSPVTGEILWCSTNCTMSRGLDGNYHIDGVVRDVTDSRRNEERLRRAEKMHAIGQLTGGIAHDFNNLLGIVIGNLDMLEEDAGDDEKVRRPVKTALRAALRGAELTKSLLAFSRQTLDVAEPWNVNELIRGLRPSLVRMIPTEISVRCDMSNELWQAAVDAGDFEDAILNLVSNACDAMAGGGDLFIESVNLTLHETERGEMDDIPPGDYVLVSIGDTGCGMPKTIVDRIFEPFFTTKPTGKGTGLGMSLVYGFARRSGGYIRVLSKPGVGTTVQVYLPRAVRREADERLCAERDLTGLNGSETILVVDDESDVVSLAQATLERLGYRVLVADNAEAALAQLAQGPRVDLLFTDVVMPGTMSGFDLAEVALERNSDLKVLMTSGFSDKTPSDDRHVRFVDSLLAKPYRQIEMAHRIRSLLDATSINTAAAD